MIFPPLFVEYSLAADVSLAMVQQNFFQSSSAAPLSIPETINISFDLVTAGMISAGIYSAGILSGDIPFSTRLREVITESPLYQYFQLSTRQIVSPIIAHCSQLVKPKEFYNWSIHPHNMDGGHALWTLHKVITHAVTAGPFCTANTLLLKRLQLQAHLLETLPGELIFEIRNLDTTDQTTRLLAVIYSHLGLRKFPLPIDSKPQYLSFPEIDKDLVLLTKDLTASIRYKTIFGVECLCPGCGCRISGEEMHGEYDELDPEQDSGQ